MDRRSAPVFVRVLAWVVSALVLVVLGFLAWANTPMMGERPAALQVWRDSRVVVTDVGDAVELAPADGRSGTGLVFIPGAVVDPYAYLYKLAETVADTGLTVLITKPTLNLAFFDTRPLADFTSHVPEVDRWYVGGHSLGGVRACQLAADGHVEGLVLFGSYCANDLSRSDLRVLSISGSRDGLSTPAKIDAARGMLPPSATMVQIEGMNHAQFGDYGPQAGDGVATISDAQARQGVTVALVKFFGQG
ncbi:alpha/beta hydrolase [uncultured Leifsonia sp.]|jgi:pimeloyl-ACP methyl ester carboxylesterase|uniref:alpha/beta hydrolase n=1 Tax=uncultured Leifsonia sp. TaxID=340359 RepID=UPI0025E1BFD0|nr:alpha/beta hydrolase [uncultured Leifsonia sp.]